MRVLGHPIHTMLVHFPLAFWSAGTVCDGLSLLGFEGAWPLAGLFLAMGLGMAVPAMAAGVPELAALEEKAAAVGARHMLLMSTALAIYAAALLTRSDGWTLIAQPRFLPILLSGAGFIVMSAGGYAGGRLVYEFGAGIGPRTRPRE